MTYDESEEKDIDDGYVPLSIKLWNQIALLHAERDEARRMYCDVISQNVSYGRSNIQKAEELGWNCYKKKKTP